MRSGVFRGMECDHPKAGRLSYRAIPISASRPTDRNGLFLVTKQWFRAALGYQHDQLPTPVECVTKVFWYKHRLEPPNMPTLAVALSDLSADEAILSTVRQSSTSTLAAALMPPRIPAAVQ